MNCTRIRNQRSQGTKKANFVAEGRKLLVPNKAGQWIYTRNNTVFHVGQRFGVLYFHEGFWKDKVSVAEVARKHRNSAELQQHGFIQVHKIIDTPLI